MSMDDGAGNHGLRSGCRQRELKLQQLTGSQQGPLPIRGTPLSGKLITVVAVDDVLNVRLMLRRGVELLNCRSDRVESS